MNNIKDQHYKKYEALTKKLSVEDISLLKSKILGKAWDNKKIKGNDPQTKLKRLIELDEHLNNIEMKFWDNLAGATCNNSTGDITFHSTIVEYPSGLSLAERVCILKHIARYF